MSVCRCDEPNSRAYGGFGSELVCWHCAQTRFGGDPDQPEPGTAEARAAVIRSLREPARETARLLVDLRAFITRYMVLPSAETADLLALWVLHTFAPEAAFATPYLRITSATFDSGKTTLLEILAVLTRHGWHAVNPSTAVLFRKIDAHAPTLLLDEIDNYPVNDRRDALSVLNAGYKRGATIDRCKDNGELQAFKCYCPKAYAGLDTGPLVATLLSRSITIRLEPKTDADHVEMWIASLDDHQEETGHLQRRCEAWAEVNGSELRCARPEFPPGLTNRGVEVWWALLAIADHAGDDWPERARRAARQLGTGGDLHDQTSPLVMLLEDIHEAFGDEQTITTEALLGKLNASEERQWGALRKGEGLDSRGLAGRVRVLKTPDGTRIRPRTVGSGTGSAKGYRFDWFADAFARYLPGPSQASEPSHPNAHGAGDATDATAATDISGGASNGALTPDEEALVERIGAEFGEGS